MEKAAADYRQGIDTNENENGEDDDDFNYMTREEQRREDVEAIEEGEGANLGVRGTKNAFHWDAALEYAITGLGLLTKFNEVIKPRPIWFLGFSSDRGIGNDGPKREEEDSIHKNRHREPPKTTQIEL